jgi:CubicO group peptidase (beta-lactamase class C family)
MGFALWGAVGALLAIAAWLLRVVAQTAGGYKAKVLSTLVFTQHRDVDLERAVEVSADNYGILRLVRARIDRQAHTVTTSFFGLLPQVATWRDGAGSTLSFGTNLPAWPAAHNRTTHPALPRDLSSRPLADAVTKAFTEPNPQRLRRTQAVLVVRGGSIVAEQYAEGFGRDYLFPGWSMAKSVAPALVGILEGEGRLSIDDRELWPGWQGRDSRASITLEDLLRMRSGLRFSESYSRPGSDVLRMLYQEPDMAAYAASLPHIAPAGRRWSYASGTTNIISAIVKRTVGEREYPTCPHRMLFDRIGMSTAVLEPDASGTFVLSSYMLATAEDWARWGLFHLRDGVWGGTRILPEGWMHFCRTPTPQSENGNYGAHWLLKLNADIGGKSAAAAGLPPDAYFAIGHEGQTLTVVPSLDLVILRHGLSIYIDAWNQAEFVADIIDAL